MKKLKFLQKNKLWLTSLGLATTSSLVLAACASNTNTPPVNNSGQNSNNQNNNSGTDSSTINTTPTPESNTPKVPVATEAQLAAAKTLLQQDTIKTVLANNKNNAVNQIKAHLLTINEVGTFSQETVAASKTSLSSGDNAAVTDITEEKAKAASVLALVNTLEAQLKAVENNTAIIPAAKKEQFTQTVTNVKNTATTLLNKLNKLPAAVTTDNNLLNTTKTAIETALDNYVKATTVQTLNPTWTALKKAHEEYRVKVNEVTPKLIDVQKSGFDLDQATSELETFINTDVGAFLSDATNGSKNTTVLNNLVAKVRTSVLGAPGYDLWVVGDAPKGIETGDGKKPSTQLYAIVVGLANQTAAWNSLNDAVKVLTFNHSLSLQTPEAVNVFALHLQVSVPVDVARLNAYLTVNESNIVKILNPTTGSIKSILDNLRQGVSHFDQFLVAGSETGAQAKLVKDLTELETALSGDSKATLKQKVTPLKTAAATLVENFGKFKEQWTKFSALLWTGNTSQETYPILIEAAALNQAIGLANGYSDVLEVVGQAQTLQTRIQTITTSVKDDTAPLLATLKVLIDAVADSGSFGTALKTFVAETTWDTDTKTKAEAIAKTASPNNSGYVYTDLINGTAATTGENPTPAKLSFSQLKTELEKLQGSSDKILGQVLALLNQQLKPSDGSQTTRLNNHLAAMFNNGDVLAKSEVHN
ncbi:hypothetical protein J2Z62_000415 [Mycoplasmoides fastidiosum]|uniref:Lipoprotein n=1 Tax=Mycoplasmoides fastidiosum TaxID=92758 RepID=A0ABU0LZ68_9BACT|nr:hypothetical protein [Mycoplasmoides fastidiosum]MDQ0513977.1 hypothetical protein [Mycoplasmoides fastidiosum]UUD37609.1 hypothetical protein NPA10_03515 [Mycoplasmoides fastidiosum]